MQKIIALIICLYALTSLKAQHTIVGRIYGTSGEKSEALPGANILAKENNLIIESDAGGNFLLKNLRLPDTLIISYTGYESKEFFVTNETRALKIYLETTNNLNVVEVEAVQSGTQISTLQTRNTETITHKEILRAACCNLSESFETNPTVNVNYTDAVTGAKEIQLLGLSGIYSQLLTENTNSSLGLSQPYGLAFIPGPWMESIQISKGAGSVVNGYEGLSGSINVEFLKPEAIEEKAYINLFATSMQEAEANFYTVHHLDTAQRWNMMMMLHGNLLQTPFDHNEDGFADVPLRQQINFYNRIRYSSGKRLEGQFGIKALADVRESGQLSYLESNDAKASFGSEIRNNRVELYAKTGMVFPESPNKSMGLQQDFVFHTFNSFIGKKSYDAKQYSYLANYIFQNEIFNCSHLIKAGASFRYMNILDFYTDQLSAFSISKPEIIPGAFLEYRYNAEEKFAVIAGTRFDYRNQFKELFTGRINVKYNFTENLIVRAAGGNSYRTANIITDNIGWMAQGKALRIDQTPHMEHGINYGVNVTYKFMIGQQEASFNMDAYRSEFINQVIADAFSNNDYIRFYNLDGRSYAQSISAILDFSIVRNIQLRMAYKFDDVHITFNGTLYQRPLLSRNKGLISLAYETLNKKWRADFTVQLDGPKLLPQDVHHAEAEIPFNQSPAYTVMNAQITKVFKRFELYLGMENIGNYTQHHLIIGADSPFSTSFDATQIWGPIMGRRLYGGIRLKIF